MGAASLHEEIEYKLLDIDAAGLEEKLKQLGAEFKFKQLFRRNVFDFPDLRLNQQYAWLRVRDEGHRTTISYKQRLGVTDRDSQNDDGMKEVEIVVDSFEHASELFKSIGMITKFYEENERIMYVLDGVEVCIDTWPLIPSYVELEGETWESLDDVARKLGFDPSKKVICSTAQIYKQHGIVESDYAVLTFDKQIKK